MTTDVFTTPLIQGWNSVAFVPLNEFKWLEIVEGVDVLEARAVANGGISDLFAPLPRFIPIPPLCLSLMLRLERESKRFHLRFWSRDPIA